MKQNKNSVLTINGGSSSIKFALYQIEDTIQLLVKGEVKAIGSAKSSFNFKNAIADKNGSVDTPSFTYIQAANFIINWLEKQQVLNSLKAIGHRIVQGMKHTQPEIITSELLEELKKITAFDPEHLPGEIKLIEIFQNHFPSLKQVACFDTAFHTSMPSVAKRLSIPLKFSNQGVQRYGFHGISYAYLMMELERVLDKESAKGKIILAHLGNGASIAAVNNGKCIDTSMGFTPSSGLVMGTRTGDLDPGVAWYLMQVEKLSAKEFNHLINHESGLLGVSETSADMQELLNHESADPRAAEAIELFCYETKKWIGAYAAALGGIHTLVFSGGIGENAAEVRKRICSGLQFLNIELDVQRNEMNEAIISADNSKVCVRVIKTNEELMIARSVCEILNYPFKN